MSPTRACNRCGRGPGLCRCRRRSSSSPRRSYSGTAAERAMRIAVLETYGDRCFYSLTDPYCPGFVAGDFVLAHVQAHADGGAFVLENLRPAHRSCNARAGR